VAAAEVASGRAAALFSAGNTGATVMAAHAAFGMLGGAERPALAAIVPTRRSSAVLLDVGANVECRPQHLVQFAAMGAVYAHLALGVERPRVGLLSIVEEETKGNELTREAHQLLKAGRLEFIGNIEARQVYAGGADVIVCDGFTGNIALKICEGLVELMGELLADGVASLISNAGATLRAVNGATRNTIVTYGGLPTAPDGVAYGITGDPLQYGQSGLFLYSDVTTGTGDLYYFKSDAAGLIRVTNYVTAASARTPRAQAQALPAMPNPAPRAAAQRGPLAR